MDLDLAQAEWTLDRFPYPQLPELAAPMMMQGFEGPAILEPVSFHRPGRWDVPPDLVELAFQEAGRAPLSPTDAVWVPASATARARVEGSLQPLEGAVLLMKLAPRGKKEVEMSPFYQLDERVELRTTDPKDRERYERPMIETAWRFLER
jgi:hypothetical protein